MALVLILWPPMGLGSGVLVCMDPGIEFVGFGEGEEVRRSFEVLHSRHYGNVLLVQLLLAHQGTWELRITRG